MLTSGTISNWTATNVGGIAPLDSRIDPVGAVLAVVVVLVGRVELPGWLERRKIWLSAATTAGVLGMLLFIFVVALFHLHFDNWSGVDNFFHSGLRGVRLHAIHTPWARKMCNFHFYNNFGKRGLNLAIIFF